MSNFIQGKILEKVDLGMFLSEVNLLLTLYRNEKSGEYFEKNKQFLVMAKEYLEKALNGFEIKKENRKARKIVLTDEAIEAEVTYHQVLSAIEDSQKAEIFFQQDLISYIASLEKIVKGEKIKLENVERVRELFDKIAARISNDYDRYLESSLNVPIVPERVRNEMG